MIRKYWVLLKFNWQILMEYRAGMAIWVIANTMPLVMLAVWITISSSGPVAGYGPAEFAGYYLALLLVRQLTTVWVAWELDYDIRLGDLSPKLLRPINPIHSHIALHLADKLFRLFTVVPLILLAVFCVPGISYHTDPLTLFLFLLSLIWALAIRFMSQYCIGLLSFWVTQSLSLNEMWYAGMLMFGGVIAPLELFPPFVAKWAAYLPFRYMLSLPVEIITGRMPLGEMLRGIGQQTVWLIFWIGLFRLLWKTGLKHYSAVGA
jgi:ABC-2 type transport system permease protein